ncbi:DUF6560 family protein [Lachnoclostridium sp. An76]|uniref:DUF6560 family protein n=1 Tax=Lachnoclostridium sp. An76 TaxID=1965654 RepID=UPI000B55E6E5|nr:DUF6560 family protein [Lachnoclostridium sp. An76]OUN34741.1 hypothetical protein B5G27_08460 [Lachnoclostridium sp. An76]
MNELIRMILGLAVQVGPYFAVFAVFGYIARVRDKKDKEREEEQKKGIINSHYVIKTETVLAIIFVVGTIFCVFCLVMAIKMQEDAFVVCVFGFFFLVGVVGTVNMIMWKLEVNGDEITWRSTFGRKRTFKFEDITYCERKKSAIRVYINGKKLFTIDSGIDDSEFMEDIKRRKIPVKSHYVIQLKKKRMKEQEMKKKRIKQMNQMKKK